MSSWPKAQNDDDDMEASGSGGSEYGTLKPSEVEDYTSSSQDTSATELTSLQLYIISATVAFVALVIAIVFIIVISRQRTRERKQKLCDGPNSKWTLKSSNGETVIIRNVGRNSELFTNDGTSTVPKGTHYSEEHS